MGACCPVTSGDDGKGVMCTCILLLAKNHFLVKTSP